MPDGNNRLFNQPPKPQTDTSMLGLNIPGGTRATGGFDAIIALGRTFTLSSLGLFAFVFTLQAALPEGRRPSDLFGGFNGGIEKAELQTKQAATVSFEREVADAKAAPPANYQMEVQINQTQMQAIKDSLGTQETVASLADLACIASMFVTPAFGDTRDAREAAAAMQSACGAGDQIRANMTATIAQAGRQGSGVVPRSNPATGAGSAPPVTVPARSR